MNRQAEAFMARSETRPAAGVAHPHESAHLHVAGEACYVDDIPGDRRDPSRGARPLREGACADPFARPHRRARNSGGRCGADRRRHSRAERLRPHRPRRSHPGRRHRSVRRSADVRRRRRNQRHRPARRSAREGGLRGPAAGTDAAGSEAARSRTCCRRCTSCAAILAWPWRRRRAGWAASSTSAARNSSISKGRSPTRCRRRTAASTSTARRSTRPRCSTSSPMRSISSPTR